MSLTFKSALVALALAAVPFTAQAGTHVVFDFGNVAFGYSDGYWDRDHRWHRWHHYRDWERYRRDYREHSYYRRHDHYRDHGWREHDRYWDR